VQAALVQAAEPQAAPAEAPSAWPAVAVVVGGFALLAVLGAILFRG